MDRVRVIGGGLAGCEAAWQLLLRGFAVELCEQKPARRTPAQTSDQLAELVCSNSMRSANPENAVGLLKEELSRCGSLLLKCAAETRVPAGDALAVDRARFAAAVERALLAHPSLTLVRGEVTALPVDAVPTIVATGPLTSDALAADIARVCGKERLAFYDAIAPIVEADSVLVADHDGAPPDAAFYLSRWGKGEGTDYLNCPLDQARYRAFVQALLDADRASGQHGQDKHCADQHRDDVHYFEGCLPIEVMAERGEQTLRFGPMKPVGLDDPRTGRWPYAVLQLRKEDLHGTAYNLVGCQTRMRQPAQRAVFSLVPALAQARFLRYGAIHRNTFLDAPAVLDERNAPRGHPGLFFAGQITGVEGYVESIASGFTTALVVADALAGRPLDVPPATTALGGLWRHARGALRAEGNHEYAPSNVTWAMLPPVDLEPVAAGQQHKKLGRGDKRARLVARARGHLEAWWRAR